MEKERIACYIRVSTELEEQDSSFKNQEFYFRNKYADREVLIYKDKGTGTSFRRSDFQKLLLDAGLDKLDEKNTNRKIVFIQSNREPLFNQIIVKDTSRFARNIIIMDIIRELIAKKVYIFFEDINKDTSKEEDMLMLQMLFTFAENTSRSISVSTKFGNKRTIEQNKIRNNSQYGYDFDREKNTLTIIQEEAEIVKLIFNLALQDGFRVIANKLKEMDIKNRKGNYFSQHTLVNMLRNKKYAGYNVRGRYDSINLFGNQKYIMKKREEWIEMPNERIQSIISEELYNNVQEKISERCIAGNRGKNVSKTDLSGKLICGRCGASFILAADQRLSNENSKSYYICSHKKTRGKVYCAAENIKKSALDGFIDEQRTIVYPASATLNIKIQIKQLQKQIREIDQVDIYKTIKDIEKELNNLQNQLELLLNNMLNDMSELTKKIFHSKVKEIEVKIKEKEGELNSNQQIILNKERYMKQLDRKIVELEKQKGVVQKELTREEYLKKVDSFIINDKKDIKVVLK
jgi:Site-specific recombinases, DNA invertase Pin homologs